MHDQARTPTRDAPTETSWSGERTLAQAKLRSAGQLATPQPRGKEHICEPDVQPERQEDHAEEDSVSRSRQGGDQNAEERRQCKVDKSHSARPATQFGANRMQSVLHPRSIGATGL